MAGHVMNFFRRVRHEKQLIAEGKIEEVLYCHSARNGWSYLVWQSRKKTAYVASRIIKNEMRYFNAIMHGGAVSEEFKPLLTGEAAIATADACTRLRIEDWKVKLHADSITLILGKLQTRKCPAGR